MHYPTTKIARTIDDMRAFGWKGEKLIAQKEYGDHARIRTARATCLNPSAAMRVFLEAVKRP